MPESKQWQDAINTCALIAILRGLLPEDAGAVGGSLVNSGYTVIEVPLNSPRPLESIQQLSANYAAQAVIGAGTVLSASDVEASIAAGATLIVAPDLNPDVAEAAVSAGVTYCPGVATPSEAFAAIDLGAHALKLFPAELLTPKVVKAMHAVLPPATRTFPVGGIDTDNMGAYLTSGACGFGLGSSLFKAGRSIEDLTERADQLMQAFRDASRDVSLPVDSISDHG